MTLTSKLGAVVIGAFLLACAGIGTARSVSPDRWSHYRDHKSGNVVVIKSRCIGAEDSAAHLTLRDYRDHGGHLVYGCSRKGY